MFFIIIKDLKKKLILVGAILVLWLAVILISNQIIDNRFICNLTINNNLSFSYPSTFEIVDMYAKDRLKNIAITTNVSLINSSKNNSLSFKSPEGKFSFDYPSSLILSQKEFYGSEILYHIDFKNKKDPSHGFVQVWNLPYSLKEFLEKSKSVSQLNYKYFKSKDITINGLNGYYWDYVFLGDDSNYYNGSEVFLQKDNKVYRISYFVPSILWDKTQSKLFWDIVDSFKLY